MDSILPSTHILPFVLFITKYLLEHYIPSNSPQTKIYICDKHSLLLDVCTFSFYRDYLIHYSYQNHCSMFSSQWMKDCGSGTEYEFIFIILVKIFKIIPRRLALFNACLKKINIR